MDLFDSPLSKYVVCRGLQVESEQSATKANCSDFICHFNANEFMSGGFEGSQLQFCFQECREKQRVKVNFYFTLQYLVSHFRGHPQPCGLHSPGLYKCHRRAPTFSLCTHKQMQSPTQTDTRTHTCNMKDKWDGCGQRGAVPTQGKQREQSCSPQ